MVVNKFIEDIKLTEAKYKMVPLMKKQRSTSIDDKDAKEYINIFMPTKQEMATSLLERPRNVTEV